MKNLKKIVNRIVGNIKIDLQIVEQDKYLSNNQKDKLRCGDNGIFRGIPLTKEEKKLSLIAHEIYKKYPYDGKYILNKDKLIICQSNCSTKELKKQYKNAIVNPLGDWIGGSNVDSGAVNRKLGSDMASSVTGGGLHGKDLSKGDVSINIYSFLKAQELNKKIEITCAIGDEYIDGLPYDKIVEIAKNYINKIGGFEKLAEWGLF